MITWGAEEPGLELEYKYCNVFQWKWYLLYQWCSRYYLPSTCIHFTNEKTSITLSKPNEPRSMTYGP